MAKHRYKSRVKCSRRVRTNVGKNSAYVAARSPWGKPALGYKKRTIVQRRPNAGLVAMDRTNLTAFIGTTSGGITFGKKLKEHMSEMGVTNEWLSEETGLNIKAIQRLRNPTTTHPELTQVIAVCVALQLPYADSIDMVNTAGYNLRLKFELEALYDYFLSHIDEIMKESKTSLVAFCNEKLIELGHKPLTKLI